MSRRALIAAAVILVAAAGAFALWAGGAARIASIWRGNENTAPSAPITGTAPAAAHAGPQAPPRVPVTLGARRQQVSGVRTAREERVMVDPEGREDMSGCG